MYAPFERLLIANRGEIACRIARTARRMGLVSIAVHSDADAGARHVAACDAAIAIGGLTAAESYLRIDAIVEAAQRSGAQAIHPGYGFLSENAAFAERCAQAGLVFIGPPADAIRAMGSKSAAKTLMERAGVPLAPGYHGDDQAPDVLQQAADRIGYPVLIKASAGGGGRGMRRVERREDFLPALASCRREATASFGDDRVLVEQYLLKPRHIEMQVFADSQGHCLHLFERDCSVQRRHQKVIEEAPAPGMTPERRAAMGLAAVNAARAVGYVGAGTVEFIVAPDGGFFFMEMNTRLQVEHPVTEMITGLDLVEWQIRVASGEPLPCTQDQLRLDGHAIEARVYAEDPERGFLPATGPLSFVAEPASTRHVRVDAGAGQGDRISPYYDAMIAKLIVWDESRPKALARMRTALDQYRIVGVANNLSFLGRLIASPAFATADLDTSLIEREHARLFAPAGEPPRIVWLCAAAAILLQRAGPARRSPWDSDDGWRPAGRARRELVFTVPGGTAHGTSAHGNSAHGNAGEGACKTVAVQYLEEGWALSLDGRASRVSAVRESEAVLIVTIDGARHQATVVSEADHRHVFVGGERAVLRYCDPLVTTASASAASAGLRSPMPGRILELLAQPGSRVAKGAPLLVLEAMKIEHTVVAPADGTLNAFRVAVGEQVSEGMELVDYAPLS